MTELHDWIRKMKAQDARDLLARMVDSGGAERDFLRREWGRQEGGEQYLREVVDAGFKPKRRFYEYRQANEYAHGAQTALELLKEESETPRIWLLKVLERALTLATRTILRSDDSSGYQGYQVRTLLDLHAEVFCALGAAGELTLPEQRRVVDWLFKYRYGGTQDFFDPDISAYAPKLDQKMVERYRANIKGLPEDPEAWFSPGWFALKRLAVVDRNPDAIIALNGGEEANLRQIDNMIEDLVQADLPLHALRMAQKARQKLTSAGHGYPEPAFLDWLESHYLHQGSNHEALKLRVERLYQATSSNTFGKLRTLAQSLGAWEEHREAAENLLAEAVPETYLAYLLSEGRDQEAWDFTLGMEHVSEDVHAEVLSRRSRTHPADVLRGYEALIDKVLIPTKKSAYHAAAKLLKQMKNSAIAAGEEAKFEDYLARTLENNKRRTTCIAIFSRAGFATE